MNPLIRTRFTRTVCTGLAFLLPLLPLPAQEERTVTTEPLGLMEIVVPSGRMKAISFPLKATPVFTGAISSLTGDTLLTQGADWPQNAFIPFSANPFVVRIISGQSQGRYFRIIGQNGETLTVDTPTALTSLLAPGDRYDIVPCDTLETLFGSVVFSHANQTQGDNVLIRDGDDWHVYYHNGSRWLLQSGNGEARDQTAILPDHGVIYHRRGARALRLNLIGEVPRERVLSELPANSGFLLANPFLTKARLIQLGLEKSPNWKSAKKIGQADYVQIQEGDVWRNYYHNGQKWIEDGKAASNPTIPRGSAIIIRRQPGKDIVHPQEPPY